MIASVDRLFTAPVARDPLGVQSQQNTLDIARAVILLKELAATQHKLEQTLADMRVELKKDIRTLCVELGGRLDNLADQTAALRTQLGCYHATIADQHVWLERLDARLSRIEQHLGLPAPA
jgi:tRNA U55 pseudouridine synthase TruB